MNQVNKINYQIIKMKLMMKKILQLIILKEKMLQEKEQKNQQ